MAKLLCKTKNQTEINRKPRVYFTSHPDDFCKYFDRIVADIHSTQDCAIYYTEDMSAPFTDEELELELGRMNLLVVPVTL